MKGSTNASARPNIRIQDASATFTSNPDTSTNTEFPYRAAVAITGVTHYMSATVIYSQAQCTSGKYASYCQTYDGGVYIYAKTNVGTQTIPAISCDISVNYINVENVPTSGSSAVITSGGVYANCVMKDSSLTNGACLRWDSVNNKAVTSTNVLISSNGTVTASTGTPFSVTSVTVPSAGKYLIVTKVQMNDLYAGSTMEIGCGIKINGTANYLESGHCSAQVFYPRISATTVQTLNANDVVDVFIFIGPSENTYTCYGEITIIRI